MLVIDRRQGESLLVSGPCEITFLGWHGARVAKFGINALPEVKVVRSELVPHPIQARNEDLDELGRRAEKLETQS